MGLLSQNCLPYIILALLPISEIRGCHYKSGDACGHCIMLIILIEYCTIRVIWIVPHPELEWSCVIVEVYDGSSKPQVLASTPCTSFILFGIQNCCSNICIQNLSVYRWVIYVNWLMVNYYVPSATLSLRIEFIA